MQNFAQWSLDAIREEGTYLSWLEELRFEWTATTLLAISQILAGKTVVLVVDERRKWFEQYLLASLNTPMIERPLLPIVSIDSLYAHYNHVSGGEMIDMVDDLLSVTYKDEYFFWYIGRGDDRRADIAKRRENSYFWIFDEDFGNSFKLRSYDNYLDIKLIQLSRLFGASLNAAMFGEIDIAE